ncbi:hypothetical protein FACS1894111_09220 [Clostridia bacterium]|nr:hypothetical protein FACS1894111_09220 [Clostridia bacterium]
MKEKEKKEQKEIKGTTPTRGFYHLNILLFSVLLVLLTLLELYFLINRSHHYLYLGGLAILILLDCYLLILSILKKTTLSNQEKGEQTAILFRSEKAVYLLAKNNFKDLGEGLLQIKENIFALSRSLEKNDAKFTQTMPHFLDEQKRIAQITINRNKENAVELMKANTRLNDQLDAFEQRLSNMEASFSQNLEQVKSEISQLNYESEIRNIENKQAELLSALKEAELSFKNELLQAVNKLSNLQPKVVVTTGAVSSAPASSANYENLSTMEEDISATEILSPPLATDDPIDFDLEETVTSENTETNIAIEIEEPLPKEDRVSGIQFKKLPEIEEDSDEPETIPEETPVETAPIETAPPMPDLSDPNKPMSPDDIAALLANMGTEDSPSETESIVAEVPVVDTPLETTPPMPDLSDPNKPMSPDDIAALLANMGTEDSPSETEPIVETAPIETAPPMPDLSDPNKPMSPDDIAALLANMGTEDSSSESEPVVEEAPVVDTPKAEPAPVDMTNPNKIMTPEEIEALLASM